MFLFPSDCLQLKGIPRWEGSKFKESFFEKIEHLSVTWEIHLTIHCLSQSLKWLTVSDMPLCPAFGSPRMVLAVSHPFQVE